jgi:hypothetical protein
MHGVLTDLTGKRFGRWTVVALDSIRNTNAYWKCRCDCGGEKAVASSSLKQGQSKSCGCLARETKSALTHGMTYSPTWTSWGKMKQRAGLNRRSRHHETLYAHVDADPRWSSFEEFFKDMGERPSKRHSLDRIDNSKGYWKDNCRWALQREQCANKRTNIHVLVDGERMCLKQACEKAGHHYNKIYARMAKGMSFDQALASPDRYQR